MQRRLAELRDEVITFLDQAAADHVYWVERGSRSQRNLRSTPLRSMLQIFCANVCLARTRRSS